MRIIQQFTETSLAVLRGQKGWIEMGGKGSGNWRHSGRPGKRGGSAPAGGLDWREGRRGRYSTSSTDGQIDYMIIPKKDRNYFVKAYLGGGAEKRLPYMDFSSVEEAKKWVAKYEERRAKEKARRAEEKPIQF